LILTDIPTSWYGYQYRCVVDGANSNVYTLQFATTWTGNASIEWDNSDNGRCGVVREASTDVIINENGFVQTFSDVICRSLLLNSLAAIRISDGLKLTITH